MPGSYPSWLCGFPGDSVGRGHQGSSNNAEVSFSDKMISSSFLNIETPKKLFLRDSQKTPVKLGDVDRRFQPTYSVKKRLKQVSRIHDFQSHQPLQFLRLDQLDLTRQNARQICDYLEKTDISDSVKRFEEIGGDLKFYDEDIREYISDEFDCVEEFSFPLIAVFTYMKKYEINPSIACEELFSLSVLKSVCEKCITGPSDIEDRMKAADFYNCSYLRALTLDCTTDSDDSFKDPDYQDVDDLCDDDGEDSENDSRSRVCKEPAPVLNQVQSQSDFDQVYNFVDESAKVFNPFLASDDSESSEQFMPKINSTVNFDKTSSSVRKETSCVVNCNFCSKVFNNRYNMKLHLIRFDS